MDVRDADAAGAPIASAIGEPARARMLYSLSDGRARYAPPVRVRVRGLERASPPPRRRAGRSPAAPRAATEVARAGPGQPRAAHHDGGKAPAGYALRYSFEVFA